MSTHRKMLNNLDEPQLQSLMQLIKTQSKETIVTWCLSYSEENLLPIHSNSSPYNPFTFTLSGFSLIRSTCDCL